MKNVSQPIVLATEVPFIEGVGEQRAVAQQLDTLQEAALEAQAQLEAARGLRETLMPSLLTGERRISIDQLVEG